MGKKQILKDISFDVKEGEIFGFVGPNGAGKTTLIKTMLGLYKKDSGSIMINGFDLNKNFEEAIKSVGAIIENPEMYDYLSGKDNLSFYSLISEGDKTHINDVVRKVKLEDRINSKVRTYSLGMKQRLGIAQALISKPRILVLDEPTNGLDPLGIKELRELLKTISKENNIAVFISSHILSEIELMCDRIAIIDNGEIIEIKDLNATLDDTIFSFEVSDVEKAKELLSNYSYKISADKLIVQIKREEVPVVNELFVKSDIKVYEIKQVYKSLEDEFIEKTKGTKGQIR